MTLEFINCLDGFDSRIMNDGAIMNVLVDNTLCMDHCRRDGFSLNHRLNSFMNVMVVLLMDSGIKLNRLALSISDYLFITMSSRETT